VNFLNSIETISSANDIQSIAFSWNTGDCSFPSTLALRYQSINVSSPICFNAIPSSINNFLLLTITSQQLANSAAIFMNSYTLTYFSIIISSSSDFYFNLAQDFSTYLTEDSYILEQFLFTTSFTSTTLSARSKGYYDFILIPHISILVFILVYYIICSYTDEISLYSKIVTYAQSTTIVFIFLRWSSHFASFYTTQFLPNTTTQANANFFPILHLLPIDIGSTSSFADIVLNYNQNILSNTTNATFSDDVSSHT
jgi:hypothetical protein